ncbi:MAG: TolC family protein [Gemmatimonadaceae bacterium]|nr:TolC family protein [Gemmatimonadaceae bacterium]
MIATLGLLSSPLLPATVSAQPRPAPDSASLEALIAVATASSPTLRAARFRVDAMRSRVGPAGLRPDPMLTVGLRDFPASRPGFYDSFTMKMVGVRQTIPYPGKLGRDRRIATREVEASEAAVTVTRLDVIRDVQRAYYEIAFTDRALDVVNRNRDLLVDVVKVADSRYGVGQGGQQDVLRARIEAGRLGEQAVTLIEQRRAALARLNAVLDRPVETPLVGAEVPGRIARAAVADSAGQVRFVSATLGARAANSPLPPVDALTTMALDASPMLREAQATIAAQTTRVERAGKEHLPDFEVAFDYGQRRGFTDLVTATVAIPIRLQRRAREDQLSAAARADLAALESELAARRNAIRAEVVRLSADLERQRTQLALYKTAIIPQGRAALTSSLASYQVGRVEFLPVLETQATLFNYETECFRVLTDFATTLAELERVVGREILP